MRCVRLSKSLMKSLLSLMYDGAAFIAGCNRGSKKLKCVL